MILRVDWEMGRRRKERFSGWDGVQEASGRLMCWERCGGDVYRRTNSVIVNGRYSDERLTILRVQPQEYSGITNRRSG